MRILGIDPGLRLTGYGCIEPCSGGGFAGYSIVEAGVFRLLKRSVKLGASDADDGDQEESGGPEVSDPLGIERVPVRSVSERLVELDRDFRELLARVRPQMVAIEGLFSHYKHPATAIVMGHARGVLLLAVRQAGMTLVEIKPAEVKKSLTGFGQSGKGQMQRAIAAEFGLAEPPSPPDVADALAIALCAARRRALV
jgi:crossover junction endodeoxyribonuclease RuvC